MRDNLNLFEQRILLFSVFILSLCGIIYELVLGSLATYLLGNPVQQYSITIGFFLSSMGLGTYLSRYLNKNILKSFIIIEVALGCIGGLSILVLSTLFSFSASYYFLHIFFLVLIGVLVGLEIPLITRILKKYGALKDILSNVLTLDYIGGLAGALLFPLVLFPVVGRLMTSIIVGMINIAVAMFIMVRIDYPGKRKIDLAAPVLALILLAGLAVQSESVMNVFQKRLYYDDIIFSKRSKYQEIVLTRNGNDFRLYLDGSLQFSSIDEYRYHEMLVLPSLSLAGKHNKRVLVLGGGDGLAVKEALRFGGVESVTLVELDEYMVNLAKNNPSLRMINDSSLLDERVKIVIGDAYDFLRTRKDKYDVIIADFPDPHDETISKLYTVEFYRMVKNDLAPGGVFVTQSTSPLFAREAFWCVHNTMKNVFPMVQPYHVYVPTFGDWGFNMAAGFIRPGSRIEGIQEHHRYFSRETFRMATHFPADISRVETKINTFNKAVLYRYYIRGWKLNIEY